MTKKEQENLIKESQAANKAVLNVIRPHLTTKHNPEFVKASKGTAFENMHNGTLKEFSRVVGSLTSQMYRNFRDGWRNVFGGSNVQPFKNKPSQYLKEYMADAHEAGARAFEKGFTDNWLKYRYIKEQENKG
tara:strand:+ start:1967 stop:2362 length:396 start_codon:yes stop_codon:yes gene_type:complete